MPEWSFRGFKGQFANAEKSASMQAEYSVGQSTVAKAVPTDDLKDFDDF